MAVGDLTLSISAFEVRINRWREWTGYERYLEQNVTRELSPNGTIAIFKPRYPRRYVWVITDAVLTLEQERKLHALESYSTALWDTGDGSVKLFDEVKQISEMAQTRKEIPGTLTTGSNGEKIYFGEFRVVIRDLRSKPLRLQVNDPLDNDNLFFCSFVLEELLIVSP